jgi:hypothetical protein
LRNVLDEVLPKLRPLNRLLGPDWSALERADLECEPDELERRLQAQAVKQFIEDAHRNGGVWVLEDEMGPAFATSRTDRGGLVLPCWSACQSAEAQCTGFWSEMMVSRIELARFLTRTLPWLIEIGRRIAPNHGLGAHVELSAPDLAGLFRQARQPGAA